MLVTIKLLYDQLQKQKQLSADMIEFKQLAEGISRSSTGYATRKDINAFAKQLDIKLDVIEKDLNKLDADVEGVQSIRVISSGFTGSNIGSTRVEERTIVHESNTTNNVFNDPNNYYKSAQVLSLNEKFSNVQVPFGEVSFKAWEKKPWGVDVYPREYNVVTVIGEDDDGKMYTYNKLSMNVNGEKFDVQINESKFLEKLPSKKFRFNPILYLGTDVGFYVNNPRVDIIPNLQVSLFSYSQSRLLPDFTFLGLGLGYATQENSLSFMLTPVNYNLGKVIPLIKNFYVGPTVSLDTIGNIGVHLGFRVSL